MVTGFYSGRVSPFGYPRIYACFRLPVAFRRSLRPSSAPSAKASSLRSSSLDLHYARIISGSHKNTLVVTGILAILFFLFIQFSRYTTGIACDSCLKSNCRLQQPPAVFTASLLFPQVISHPVRSLSTAWLLPQLPSSAGLRLSVSSLSVSRLAAAQPLFGSLFRLPGRSLKEFFCWNCRCEAVPIPLVGSMWTSPLSPFGSSALIPILLSCFW